MYIIAKYDINGKHIVLDGNKPKVFETIGEATEFLKAMGFTKEEIDDVSIEEASQADLEDEYVPDNLNYTMSR